MTIASLIDQQGLKESSEKLQQVFCAGVLAFLGIQEQNLREAEKGVQQYLRVLDNGREENLESAILQPAVASPVPEELREALEELDLMVRLLSIKDPFDGWRALTKEIS